MSFRAMVLKRSLWSVILLTLITVPVIGQVAKSPIVFVKEQAITTSFVTAPSTGSTSDAGNGDSNQWLKIEFHYGVIPPDPIKMPYLPSVEFKVWVEGIDLYAENAPGKDGVSVLLTGSVTYINLKQARDAYGVFYIHPSTLGRYGGKDGYQSFDRKFNIHVEADVNGQPVDVFDKNKDKDGPTWYTKIPTTIPGLVYNMNQSPFLQADIARYPVIKLPAQAAGQ